jgi:SNF2 family DNA or RNA helicase
LERYKNGQVQMRKICCHPYLFDGIEPNNLEDPMPSLIEASGKMIVLDKLLQKLLKEDHKILIFSQFTVMLDILEDYCTYREYPISRIDGSMPL